MKFGHKPSGKQAFLLRAQRHSISLDEGGNFRKESCKSNILGIYRNFIYIKPWGSKHFDRFAKEIHGLWVISRSFIMTCSAGSKVVFGSNMALSWLRAVFEAVGFSSGAV